MDGTDNSVGMGPRMRDVCSNRQGLCHSRKRRQLWNVGSSRLCEAAARADTRPDAVELSTAAAGLSPDVLRAAAALLAAAPGCARTPWPSLSNHVCLLLWLLPSGLRLPCLLTSLPAMLGLRAACDTGRSTVQNMQAMACGFRSIMHVQLHGAAQRGVMRMPGGHAVPSAGGRDNLYRKSYLRTCVLLCAMAARRASCACVGGHPGLCQQHPQAVAP